MPKDKYLMDLLLIHEMVKSAIPVPDAFDKLSGLAVKTALTMFLPSAAKKMQRAGIIK